MTEQSAPGKGDGSKRRGYSETMPSNHRVAVSANWRSFAWVSLCAESYDFGLILGALDFWKLP